LNEQLADTGSFIDVKMPDWTIKKEPVKQYMLQFVSRIDDIQKWFNEAAKQMTAAQQLQKEAQSIYGYNQMRSMREELIKKWMDTARASVGSAYRILRDRATLAWKIAEINADFQKTLASMTTQQTQLVDQVKSSQLSQSNWLTDNVRNMVTALQTVRNNYLWNIQNVMNNFVLQPIVNLAQDTWKTDLNIYLEEIKNQMVSSSPIKRLEIISWLLWEAFIDAPADLISRALAENVSADELASIIWDITSKARDNWIARQKSLQS
jgi:hypothetical protein